MTQRLSKISHSRNMSIFCFVFLGDDAFARQTNFFFFFLSVRPPKKSWKKIFNLSGGEKTLSSLALVFALHHYKPTPLYFMDEIDAALDFKNVSIVACYIYVSMERLVLLMPQTFTLLSSSATLKSSKVV